MTWWSLACALHGLATGFTLLLIARFLLGIGEGDACIHKELGGHISGVNEVTRQLAKGGSVLGFARSDGICGLCRKVRLVIHSVT